MDIRESLMYLAKKMHKHLPLWSHKQAISDSIARQRALRVGIKGCKSISRYDHVSGPLLTL